MEELLNEKQMEVEELNLKNLELERRCQQQEEDIQSKNEGLKLLQEECSLLRSRLSKYVPMTIAPFNSQIQEDKFS